MIIKNNKNKSIRHHTATCFFVLLLVGSFLFGANTNAALLGTYTKAISSTLTAAEWNNLIQDFLSTIGGVVNGPVGIGTATSSSYMLNVVGGINGNYGGTLSAASVSQGQFGLNTGGGPYSFSGNLGIGITTPAAKLHVYGDGTYSALFMNGNVGIGTSSPAVKLDVLGDIRANGIVQSSQIGGSNFFLSMDATNVNGPRLQMGYNYNPSALFEIGAWGGINNFDSKTRDLKLFTTNGLLYMTNTTGFIGIGTTNPTQLLDVAGNIKFGTGSSNPMLTFNGTTTAAMMWDGGNPRWLIGGNGNQVGGVYFYTNGLNNTAPIIFGSGATPNVTFAGNVGIGTTTPTSKLTISGGDLEMDHNTSIKVSSSTANTTLLIGNYADGLAFFSYGTSTAATNKTVNLAVEGDVKANRLCIGEDCKSTWTAIVAAGGGTKAVYVGSTSGTYSGNNSGVPGYNQAYILCEAAYSGSHVCTPDDMLSNIKFGTLYPSTNVWIFAGPPGYIASANDCGGRTKNVSTSLGAYWEATTTEYTKGRGFLMECQKTLNIACCN